MKSLKNIKNKSYTYYDLNKFSKLSRLIGSIRENELITIGARVGCGKTSLALNLMSDLAKQNYKCWFISYEMNGDELKTRLGDASSLGNIYVDDECSDFDVEFIRKTIKNCKIDFVFIDYVQLMSGNIKKNTKALKKICKDLGVVIFMLAQLNRQAQDKEPQLSMLKDSGTIEQDSDEVWFIKEHSIKVAKNRKGRIGEIPIVFDKSRFDFRESNEYQEKRLELINKAFSILEKKTFFESKKMKEFENFLDEYVISFDFELWEKLMDCYIKWLKQGKFDWITILNFK